MLSKYLEEIDLDIKIKDCNVFYFDSSPFRYLATLSQGHTPKEDRWLIKDCWNKSVESCRKMIKYIDEELEKHDTKETLAVSDTKSLITLVIKPLVQICKVNEENIAIVKKTYENLAKDAGLTLFKTVDMREKVLTFKKLDKPLTVCTNNECCEMQNFLHDGEKLHKNLHRKVCCRDCIVPFVSNEVKGCKMLYFCAAIKLSGKCKVCKHSKKEHMHIFYEMNEADRVFEMKTKDISEKKDALETELDFIMDTLAFFSKYLECHSLIKESNIIVSRIEEQKKRAHLELGIATKISTEAEKEVQENNIPDKDKIEEEISDLETELDVLTTQKNSVRKLEVLLFSRFGHHVDFQFTYQTLKNKIKDLVLRVKTFPKDDDEAEIDHHYEYFNCLKAKEDSLKDALNQQEHQLQLLKDLQHAHKEIDDKTMEIDALDKILRKYEDKLTSKRNDLTPANVTKRLKTLCLLKYNGETFQQMDENINQRRNNEVVKKQKSYKGYNIPFQNFLQSKIPFWK